MHGSYLLNIYTHNFAFINWENISTGPLIDRFYSFAHMILLPICEEYVTHVRSPPFWSAGDSNSGGTSSMWSQSTCHQTEYNIELSHFFQWKNYSNQDPNGYVTITSVSMGPIAMRSATRENLETQLAICQILTSTGIEPLKDNIWCVASCC
jgi:hypothetical protein